MVTNELIDYIKSELSNDVSKDLIISSLIEAGWYKEDIDEGFLSVEKGDEQKEEKIDPYRELPDEGDPLALKVKLETATEEETRDRLKIKINEEVQNAPEVKITPIIGRRVYNDVASIASTETPIEYNPVEEAPKIENIIVEPIPVINQPKIENIVVESAPVITEKKVEAPSVLTPTAVKPVEPTALEIYSLELSKQKESIATPKEELPKKDSPVVNISSVNIQVNNEIKEQPKKVETATPAPLVNKTASSVNSQNQFDIMPPLKKDAIKEVAAPVSVKPIINTISPVVKMSDVTNRSAMISSYRQDILASTVKEENISARLNRKNTPLKLGIIVVIITLIVGMIFAFVQGYIKIPGAKASFFVVKNDPKEVLLGESSALSKFKSYKTETSVNISSPSLSNIAIGLSSGDVVNSKDTDSMSMNIKGQINNENISDYIFDIDSSLLKNSISTNIKKDDTNMYMTIPDLSQIFGDDTPDPTTISFKRSQLSMIINELPVEIRDFIKKADVYNIISSEVPLYVENEMHFIFKDFIESLSFVNKGEEEIHGVNTNHYEVTATRAATKKMLSSLSDLFMTQLSPDEKTVLNDAIGASSISSFELWIGKNDGNLYQVKIVLNTPLSKVLKLNDSGIAGNEVKLDWTTTFYDFDVDNKINMPIGELDMDSFVKNIQNIKIKNLVSSLKSQSVLFKNAVGSYGKKSNPTGSCMTPESGSMFSPEGHNKGADTAVSSISGTMNSLLSITKNEGYCYSTPNAWALIVPLSTTPISYYCADSAGNKVTVLDPISETSCVSKKAQ